MGLDNMKENIKFCKRCLYSNQHPLGLTIDEKGICSGCRIHEEKDNLDWDYRWELLKKIIKPYRSESRENYDCIVPVTAANDSYYIVHLVKNKLKLNPLLVTYNKYFNTPLGIKNLANLRIKFNCDILIQNINLLSVKKITKSTMRRFGSIYWPCLAGQTVFPVQTAINYKIPLIIWGAHQGIEQVGMFSHEDEVEMTRRYRKNHDLMGYEADDLITIFDTLNEEDIWQYRYPDDDDINSIGVRGIYLGNYIRWDPKTQHEKMIKNYGYLTSKFERTFDCYDHVDCFNFMNLHDELKLFKNGYSKVTDHATREIRHGRLSRDEGLSLVKKYELKNSKYNNLFNEWLGIEKLGLKFLSDQHKNSKYFDELSPGNYSFKGWSFLNQEKIISKTNETSLDFIANSNLLQNQKASRTKYIIIGKGFP